MGHRAVRVFWARTKCVLLVVLHNKPTAEVHPGHKLTGPKEEEEEEEEGEEMCLLPDSDPRISAHRINNLL
jgi:hypothetical protein